MLFIAGQQVCCTALERGGEDWAVLFWQAEQFGDAWVGFALGQDNEFGGEMLKNRQGIGPGESDISACFFHRVGGCKEDNVLKLPKAQKRRVVSVGSGKEYVGVEEKLVHGGGLRRLLVDDSIRVEAHGANFLAGAGIILGVHGVGENELSDSLRSVYFDGRYVGGSDQDAVVSLLCDDGGSLRYAELLSEFGGDGHGSAPADFGCLGKLFAGHGSSPLDEAFSTVIMHKGVFSVNRGEKGAYASPLPEQGEGLGVRASVSLLIPNPSPTAGRREHVVPLSRNWERGQG